MKANEIPIKAIQVNSPDLIDEQDNTIFFWEKGYDEERYFKCYFYYDGHVSVGISDVKRECIVEAVYEMNSQIPFCLFDNEVPEINKSLKIFSDIEIVDDHEFNAKGLENCGYYDGAKYNCELGKLISPKGTAWRELHKFNIEFEYIETTDSLPGNDCEVQLKVLRGDKSMVYDCFYNKELNRFTCDKLNSMVWFEPMKNTFWRGKSIGMSF